MAGASTQSSHLTMRLETDLRTSSQCSRAVPLSLHISRHCVECFLANFIPGIIGSCGGIES